MTELLATFRGNLLWSLLLWFAFYVAFAAIFARGHLGSFGGGLMRVLLSIVATPFGFIRRAVGAMIGYSSADREEDGASDQYLLNRGMLVLQALVIIAAIGALAAGALATWNTLVSPAETRRLARESKAEVETQRQVSAAATAKVTELDNEWTRKEAAVAGKYRQERQSRAAVASRDLAALETEVRTLGGPNTIATLNGMKDLVAARSFDSSSDVSNMKDSLDRYVYNNWYMLGDWGRPALQRWSELWAARKGAEVELAVVPLIELRIAEQPDYASATAAQQVETEKLSGMEQVLAMRQEAASLKWKPALFRALRSFVAFLLFVWVVGAVIEAGWMLIRIADDVRRIRQRATAPAQTAAAAPVQTTAAAPATVTDVRLPIRPVLQPPGGA